MNAGPAPDRYAVIGFPVHHSRSPLIHSLFAQQTGQNLSYELLEADERSFESKLREFGAAGGCGLNVTVPHKASAYRLAQQRGVAAEQAGSVNTLTFTRGTLRGDNTDGIGFLRDLTVNLGFAIEARRVLVLGAGGAARGILPPLLSGAPAELVLANRTLVRAAEIRDRLHALGKIEISSIEELSGRGAFDLVVNATSAGLSGAQPAFPSSIVGPSTLCYDLIYTHGDTPFVSWAREQGAARAEQGVGMLVEQAAESFFIWRGVRPDTATVIRQLAA